jgi:hypothetical protein
MPRRTDLVLATPAQPLAQLVERAQAYKGAVGPA